MHYRAEAPRRPDRRNRTIAAAGKPVTVTHRSHRALTRRRTPGRLCKTRALPTHRPAERTQVFDAEPRRTVPTPLAHKAAPTIETMPVRRASRPIAPNHTVPLRRTPTRQSSSDQSSLRQASLDPSYSGAVHSHRVDIAANPRPIQ